MKSTLGVSKEMAGDWTRKVKETLPFITEVGSKGLTHPSVSSQLSSATLDIPIEKLSQEQKKQLIRFLKLSFSIDHQAESALDSTLTTHDAKGISPKDVEMINTSAIDKANSPSSGGGAGVNSNRGLKRQDSPPEREQGTKIPRGDSADSAN